MPHTPRARPRKPSAALVVRWRHRLSRLAGLPRAEIGELLAAQAFLVLAQLLVWVRPEGRLIARSTAAGAAVPGAPEPRALRLGRAVERAAEHGLFRPKCLVRALALHRLLEWHGLHGSRICVGVGRTAERFAAHAWVEYGGVVLADRAAHVRRYARLSDFHLHSR